MKEDKAHIIRLMFQTMKATACYGSLINMYYENRGSEEVVVMEYTDNRVKEINVNHDSGYALMMDVLCSKGKWVA